MKPHSSDSDAAIYCRCALANLESYIRGYVALARLRDGVDVRQLMSTPTYLFADNPEYYADAPDLLFGGISRTRRQSRAEAPAAR